MKIIIVDGDGQSAAKTEEMLASTGQEWEISGVVQDGRTGYKLISEKRPDLLIMDLMLSGMSGLSLLRKLRADKLGIRVLILTSDTDFNHARQAIELGVDNYMLKPVKKSQLKKAVLQIQDKLEADKIMKKAFTVENIFTGCLSGQYKPDRDFHQLTRERFGFTLEDPGAVFTLWFGSNYMANREDARHILQSAGKENGLSVCVLEVDIWRMLLAVVYRIEPEKSEYDIFKNRIMPVIRGSIPGEFVCMWNEMEHTGDLLDTITEMRRLREWNLLFERGQLISPENIRGLQVLPLKYPAELEDQMKKAVSLSDGEEIKKCYYRLYDLFRQEIYSPQSIKECLIRFNITALNTYKARHVLESELRIQYCMQAISEAVDWGQIREAMEEFFELLRGGTFEAKSDESLSPLVRNAVQMVRKYYDHGLTLEETADRLFVSEEYLSSQFKKETGRGFKETVRHYRIERIKDLLMNTSLKLNQIAELTGYADPKYMSRVFREETGMLPNEFRKTAH